MEILKTIISWTHIISASLSLVLGALILYYAKGTKIHKKRGKYYFYLMIINNVTALMIYNAFGKWFFPHWLAVVTLIVIIPGFLVTKNKKYKHWLKIHITCLVLSYYLLIGGAINELFLRIDSLRPLIINNSPIVGIVHSVAILIFTGLIIYFLRKYWKMKTGHNNV